MQNQIKDKSSNDYEPYFIKSELQNIHEKAKEQALSQVRDTKSNVFNIRLYLQIFSVLVPGKT